MNFRVLLLQRGGRCPLPNPLPQAGEGADVMPLCPTGCKVIDDRFGSMAEEGWEE